MFFPRRANSVAFIFYGSYCANSTELSPIRSVIIRMVNKIGRPRSERHSVLLPIYQNYDNIYETNQPSVRARCVITVRLHTSYWEITQAWRTPIKFDNFAIVLISLVRRMTVSFLLLWSLMLCMLFQAFFPPFLWHATAEHSPYFFPVQLWVPFFPKAVIPLNEECGLLEWVQNTHGLRNILTKIYK